MTGWCHVARRESCVHGASQRKLLACYPATSPIKLRWRALVFRHCFHVLPGESILELGAGRGLWTHFLTEVLGGENPIKAAVFNPDLIPAEKLPDVSFLAVTDLLTELPAESFDYVVGTAILCHSHLPWRNVRSMVRPIA
jgi:dolichol-phosphate mannosyltransferase